MRENLNKERLRRATPLCIRSKSGPDHCEKNAGEDRPDHANNPKELSEEDAPDLA
jgi:hypothetical protein